MCDAPVGALEPFARRLYVGLSLIPTHKEGPADGTFVCVDTLPNRVNVTVRSPFVWVDVRGVYHNIVHVRREGEDGRHDHAVRPPLLPRLHPPGAEDQAGVSRVSQQDRDAPRSAQRWAGLAAGSL